MEKVILNADIREEVGKSRVREVRNLDLRKWPDLVYM